MNLFGNVYKQSLEENTRNLNNCQDFLNNLNGLDLKVFKDKLTVPILVPIGNKILFRGALKHTNEVTVSLGADYFVKCSLMQAETLRQHRINDVKSKLESYKINEEYLEKQINLNKSIYENPGKDIIETCTEEEDKLWREKHRERVRQYNLSAEKKMEKKYNQVTDDELWTRLEELEIQEELEEEYRSMTNRQDYIEPDNSYIFEHTAQEIKPTEENTSQVINTHSNKIESNLSDNGDSKLSKTQLLQQIIERQKSLELKLTELKNKNTAISRTENDLFSKLDEIEQLDELEDEIDRLDDILEEDSDDTEDTTEEISNSYSKKTVSFADDYESETLELAFKHSNVEPNTSPYDPKIGITNPSHIYEAFSDLFVDETMSILKKKKSGGEDLITKGENVNMMSTLEDIEESRTIVIKDVSEKEESNEKVNSLQRPVSLFKKRRQQQKT